MRVKEMQGLENMTEDMLRQALQNLYGQNQTILAQNEVLASGLQQQQAQVSAIQQQQQLAMQQSSTCMFRKIISCENFEISINFENLEIPII